MRVGAMRVPREICALGDRRVAAGGALYSSVIVKAAACRSRGIGTRERGEFLWTIRETGWKGSTAELAIEIAKALVAHYDEYRKRFPHAL
jgi:hypothetical protein